jgi:5'-3' exonuclease
VPVTKRNSPGLTMLVDASSLIYRAFFSTPETVTSPKGLTVNAAHGFINMLSRLVADHDPEWLVCASDADWRPEWRVELIDTYKRHRTFGERSEQAEHVEQELEHQMPIIEELLELSRICVVGVAGYEAEDVIGALVPQAGGRVDIVSGDRDLFQLVRDPDVRVLYPKRGVSDLVVVDEAEIERRYGIPGRAYGDYALLRGDPSDGLPGVRGIGEKTAAALISRHGTLEAVIEAAMTKPLGALGKVAASLDYIDKAAQVVLITGDVAVGDPDMTRPRGGFADDLVEKAESYGLAGPVNRLLAALARRERR